MNKINIGRLLGAAVVMAVVFLIAEFIIEFVIGRAIGVSEEKFFRNFNLYTYGVRYHVLNILIFFGQCILVMWVFAVLMVKSYDYFKTALITSAFFVILQFLILANFTNIGIISIKAGVTIFIFGLLELPPSVFAGGRVYYTEPTQMKE